MALPGIFNIFKGDKPKKGAKPKKPKVDPKTTIAQHLSNDSKKYLHKVITKKIPLLGVVSELLKEKEEKADPKQKLKTVKKAAVGPLEPKHTPEKAEAASDGSTLSVITQNLDQIKEIVTGVPGNGELDPETEKRGGIVSTLFLGLMGGLVALAVKFSEMIPFELITKSLKFIGEIWTKIKGSSVLKWVFKKAGILEETERVAPVAAPTAQTMAQVAQVKDAIVAEAAKVPGQVLPKAAKAGVPKAVSATQVAQTVAASKLLVTTDPRQAPVRAPSTISPPPQGKPIGSDWHPVGQGKGHRDAKFKGFGKDVDSYIDEGAKRFGIDTATLRGFVKMEGGWTGRDSNTGAIGIGQFTYDTWNELAGTADGKSIGMKPITKQTFRTQADPRRDQRTNALATALLAKNNADRLRKAGVPVTGENLYMAHNIGTGGFIRAMSGANLSATEWRNLRVNGWKPGMTSQDFVEFQKGRFRDAYASANSVPEASSTGLSTALAQSNAAVPVAPKTTIIRQPGQSTIVQQSTPTARTGGRVVQRIPNPITDNNIGSAAGGSTWANPH
jgi:hypothetical protein